MLKIKSIVSIKVYAFLRLELYKYFLIWSDMLSAVCMNIQLSDLKYKYGTQYIKVINIIFKLKSENVLNLRSEIKFIL